MDGVDQVARERAKWSLAFSVAVLVINIIACWYSYYGMKESERSLNRIKAASEVRSD